MIAAICLEDRNGLLFNGRRLSRDRAQQEDLMTVCGAGRLWISPFSAPLFAPWRERLVIAEDFLYRAGRGAVCFVEDRPLRPVLDRLEALILYRWNRTYPADVYLDLDPAAEGFVLEQQCEFSGTSHPCITREIYRRGGGYGKA